MKRLKRLSLLLITIIMIIGVYGCMKNRKMSTEDVASKLREKYNDTFSLVSIGNELWNKEYSEIVFSSEKLKADIVAWVYSDGTIVDNYIAVKYKDDVETFIFPLAKEIYNSCIVVNVPIHYGKNYFNNTLAFSDYVSNKQSSISIAIATDKDSVSAKKDIEEFAFKLKENGVVASIRIFYYDKSTFSTVKETNDATTIFSPLSNKRLSATMNEDYSIGSIDWSE